MNNNDLFGGLDLRSLFGDLRFGFYPVYGARPLRREVERQVENPLAMRIVRGACPANSSVTV